MAGCRHHPPVRIFRLVSIAEPLVDDFDEDEDGIEYDPVVVAKVLKAAEGPLIYAGTLEQACRLLGIWDEEEDKEEK